MADDAPKLFLLDLDRTVFKTETFMADAAEAMRKLYGVETGRFRANTGMFMTSDGGYDFFGHARAVSGQSLTAVRSAMRKVMKGDYLYPDVKAFVRAYAGVAKIAVMAGGQVEFQKFKISLCNELKSCAVVLMPRSKGQRLAEALVRRGDVFLLEGLLEGEYSAVSVVDDNPAVFDNIQPQPGLALYRIGRADDNYDKVPNSFFVTPVSSLMEVK